MPLSGPQLGSEIEAALGPWNGVQLTTFSLALGNGIVLAIAGKLAFNTADLGVVAGSGAGKGLGITGLEVPLMAQLMFDKGQTFWSPKQNNGPGTQWLIFCTKLSMAVDLYLKDNADLVSAHSPVAIGSGKVLAYYGVTEADMTDSITLQSPAGWQKASMPQMAAAVSAGIMGQILDHSPTDSVVIAGSPGGTPSGGGGGGAGIVL